MSVVTSALHVAVVGASGGIGNALVEALLLRTDVACVHATGRRQPPEWCDPRVHPAVLDASDEEAVARWASGLEKLDWLINAAGLLHNEQQSPEKTIRQFKPEHLAASVAANTLPSLLLAKHSFALLKKSEAGVFASLSARVGSIEDNRLGGWVSYRASKAALNMSLKCLAIEWQRLARQVRVLALHPGTTDTGLSKPFQANVPPEQLFSAEKTAGLLVQRIAEAHRYDSGRFIDYAGADIPW